MLLLLNLQRSQLLLIAGMTLQSASGHVSGLNITIGIGENLVFHGTGGGIRQVTKRCAAVLIELLWGNRLAGFFPRTRDSCHSACIPHVSGFLSTSLPGVHCIWVSVPGVS